MNTNGQHALQAWKDSRGDPLTAIKLLRDQTNNLGLREALEVIQKTAAQVGDPFTVRICTAEELPPELAEALSRGYEGGYEEDTPRLAEHRTRRGVKKVRGAK
jgi:hypothetical protein